MKYALN